MLLWFKMTKIKAKKAVVIKPASSTRPAENLSSFNLCKLIKLLNRKKLVALKWFQKIGMLNRESACDNCGRPMTLVHRQNCTGSRADKYEWECNKCRMCTKSLRSGTVFQSSKLSLQKITILMYFWAHDFPPHVAQRELSITERTVNKWYLLCQEACMDALIRNTSKLGGDGRNLEVVEGKLGKRVMDSYRTPADHPVIGVIDVESGSCFLQVVIGNTKATLLTLLKERIANGSTLHSKCWKVCDCFSDEKFCKVVKNHKLTLSNEDGNAFKKLHSRVCKSGDKVGTLVSFDPVLCATIYKNAMKNEEFFFVKFLGELGTLYRDGIRYEMMNQLEHYDSEPGPSIQRTHTSDNTEWTSTIGTPCPRCRSKQYTNSEVQASESDDITVYEDVNDTRNVSVSKQNVCKSGHLSEGNSGASDDIIVLDDACKSQNSIASEQTVLLPGDVSREQSSVCHEVTEVEQSDKPTKDGRSARTVNTAGHISETECAEVNKVSMLEKRSELPISNAREKNMKTSRLSPTVESCAANGVISLDGDGNLQNDGGAQEVVRVSRCDGVVDIGGDELKEVSTNVDVADDKQSGAVTDVGHFDEIDISMEEPVDVHEKVGETETVKNSVNKRGVKACEQEDIRGDVSIVDGGDSEMAAHVRRGEDPDIIVYEQKDTNTDVDVTSEMRPRTVSKSVNTDSVYNNTSQEEVVPVKMIVPIKSCTDVASDVNIDDVEGTANGCTVKEKKTNVSPDRKRNEESGVVNIDEAEDNSNECTVKEGKTNATPGKKRGAGSDLVNIDGAEDSANEFTVKSRETNTMPCGKKAAGSELVNIDSEEDSANESTVKGSKTNATDARKREAAPELVNIENGEDEHTIKRSKTDETASRVKAATCDVVHIDNTEDNANECTVEHRRATVGMKRASASDPVNIDVAEECTVKRSKLTTNGESEEQAGSALVNIEDNANEQEGVFSKRNVTAKRKSDIASEIVNIDDNSNEQRDVISKTDGTPRRKSDVVSEVVNIDDVEDNADENEGRQESVNQTSQKESGIFSDVIDIDEADSDIEVIETEAPSVPDIMVVGEERRKVYMKEETRRHERRLLVDDVPCNLPKSVLRTYFAQFGKVEYIKILPIPSRRSLRYAVLEFSTKEIVDTIQAARPHVLETGVKFVTFRGSSPDIDSSLNTRLKKRMIVKVPRNKKKLTTEDVQQYFSEYGHIYDAKQVTLTGMETGSSTFVVNYDDYDSADMACIKSPHTIKGVENVTCEKIEDDDLLLSGTEMDPICIENDSDVEEVQVDYVKKEPSSSGWSQEGKGPDEPSTSGEQSGGGKRPSDGVADVTPKKFRSYNTFERNVCTPHKIVVGNLVQLANGTFGLPAVPSGSGYGGRSGINSWQGRPFYRTVQRPAQTATPAPPAAGGALPDDDFRKRQAEIRPHRPQSQPQPQPQRAPLEVRWQPARRPLPPHFQPRRAQPWTYARWEPSPSARPATTQRALVGVPITSSGFAGPSHVTRTRPGPAATSSANARTFIPRASGSQGPRF